MEPLEPLKEIYFNGGYTSSNLDSSFTSFAEFLSQYIDKEGDADEIVDKLVELFEEVNDELDKTQRGVNVYE